jgi:hypothetical protein
LPSVPSCRDAHPDLSFHQPSANRFLFDAPEPGRKL